MIDTPTPLPAAAPARARYISMDPHHAAHLRRLGYTVTAGAEPERGCWIARDGFCGWFADSRAALVAVGQGWPGKRLTGAG